jgi:autotransporter-associated beta strand protein
VAFKLFSVRAFRQPGNRIRTPSTPCGDGRPRDCRYSSTCSLRPPANAGTIWASPFAHPRRPAIHQSRAPTAAFAAAVLAFVTSSAAAQTWTGTASGSWANAANWSPAGIPVSSQNSQLTFGVAATTAMTNDIAGPFAFNQLTFNAGDPVYTLTGNDLSALTSSGIVPAAIVMNSANSVTVGNNIALTNPLTVSGAGAGPIALNGVISGGGGLTFSALGTLTLGNAANTYSGGTNVRNGTVQVASDAALGAGNVTGAALGTVSFTGTTTTAKSFAMNGGTVAVAAGKTLTFNGSVVSSAFLDGAGTFATNPTNGAGFVNVTATPSVAINSNSAADQFVHFTNSGTFNVAPGLGSASYPYTGVTLNGFTNEGIGSITIRAASKVTASNFQSYGTLALDPAAANSNQFTLVTNVGTAPLGFNAGSRVYVPGYLIEHAVGASPLFVAGFDLDGKNALVVGGVFANNYGGFIFDFTNNGSGTGTIIADYGSLVRGDGYFGVQVITQNGGKVQAGNSPGTASFGRFVFGPGGVSNYVFDINDATGTAGANSNANGWGLVKAVQQSVLGSPTSSGNFTWTATPTAKLTVALDTIVGTTAGDTDVAGPMANFDLTRCYSWLAAQWAGTYSGPTDAATLDASTSFDTSGFLNPTAGSFGWSLDPAAQTLSLVYTPSSVPEPGTLALTASLLAIDWVRFWRRRWQSNGGG